MIPNNIKNIIFDFGRVILELDEQKTIQGLSNILQLEINDFYTIVAGKANLEEYEIGKVSSESFIQSLVDIAPEGTKSEDIIHAWNAMLGTFPIEHVALLKKLKTKYRTFLLSNTNELHVIAFESNMKAQGIQDSMQSLFEKVWYSNEIGMRKPYPETYISVMNSAQIKPEETLFLDDRQENLDGAKKAGLHTQLITDNFTLIDFFKDWEI